jgi:diaminopropionate ammonia-lyase
MSVRRARTTALPRLPYDYPPERDADEDAEADRHQPSERVLVVLDLRVRLDVELRGIDHALRVAGHAVAPRETAVTVLRELYTGAPNHARRGLPAIVARYHLNPDARGCRAPTSLLEAGERRLARDFFRSAAGRSTPLRHLMHLAASIGLGDLLLKDETERLGLNAFKILGVSFAIERLLADGRLPSNGTVTCATAGNHGRAVARAARARGLEARIYVPAVTEATRRAAIASEGADVIVVPGSYEAAVRQAADDARRHGWLVVADTSWPGYEEIPRWIMTGYTRLLDEAARQWRPLPPPEIVLVQAGVGGLAAAVASWLVDRYGADRPFVIVCEPESAACALESARAGRPVSVGGPGATAMAGLRCAEISPMVWPVLATAVDGFIAVADTEVEVAMRRLADPVASDPAVTAGASGACGVAALLALATDADLGPLRDASRLAPSSRALVICTEGPTDPAHFERVVGHAARR